MLKVYLAAPYKMKEVIRTRAEELRGHGIGVTSSWLEEPEKPTVALADVSDTKNRQYAHQDILDVEAADILVFQTDLTKTILRAGRHVEFGIAIGLGRTRPYPILVVGEDKENIFHHLPQVYHFKDWPSVVEYLSVLARVENA